MSRTFRVVVWGAAMSLVTPVGFAVGQPTNPYQAIAERNVFQLIEPPPPPPPPPPPRQERAPPPRLLVTGLTDVCGRPQVLLEMGAKANTVGKFILEQGAFMEGIRVLEIDVRGGLVKVDFEGETMVLPLNPGGQAGGRGGPNESERAKLPVPMGLKVGR
jgi:hypothetical protein